MTKTELQNLIKAEVSTQLVNYSQNVQYYQKSFSNVTADKGTSTTLDSITIPAGKYVLVGFARYVGTDLRYHITLGNANSSAYDNSGNVAMNVSDIVEIDKETTYDLKLWPSTKAVTVDGWIKAIRIGD